MPRGVLLDLGGVVFTGETALPGAVAAVGRLHAAGVALRYVTNTTRKSRRALLAQLRTLGLAVAPEEVFMPALAARAYLAARGLSPHLLVHPGVVEDFAGLPATGAPAVVIGDAGEGFTYPALNAAFRALDAGAEFLALAPNRVFLDADGALSLDAGPFVAALEFATGRRATVLGKPAPAFFAAALDALGCRPADAAMIGDDAENDVAGAQRAGLCGVLVRTGKYRPGDEKPLDPPPRALVDDLPAAVDWLLAGG